MDNKEFDQMLKERFSKEAPEGQDAGWQKLSAMLPVAPQKRRALAYWKIAASVLLVLGLSLGFSILFTKQNKTVPPSEITGNQDLQDKQDIGNAPTAEPQPDNNQESTAPSQSIPQTSGNIAGSSTTNVAKIPDNKHSNTGNKSAVTATTIVGDKPNDRQPIAGQNESQDAPVTTTPNKVVKTTSQQVVPNTNSTLNPMAYAPTSRHEVVVANNSRKTTSIAFGGGMNYGVLNTGYNVNVSAKHALGKHVFVEGSVAFLYNSQAEKSSFYAAQNFSPTRPAPGQISASKTTNPAASNFYYLSVNPAMGYQINKTIALSAGPDLQQRIASLGQDGTAIYTPGLDPRIIPQLDLGFTGKADFFISPKIETSILFRDGLNNLLKKPDMHPYLNRRYIQVQLNYNFLLSK